MFLSLFSIDKLSGWDYILIIGFMCFNVLYYSYYYYVAGKIQASFGMLKQ
ncbi:hypothetical protein KKE19_01625 [Patescibacteria group bacterium]|nr:hypothetical protein [Patescibacteria group bacterium]MBU4367397.1 hypothetical protein [Patescibacteria group bacterium]MCG2700101.1 hypothetical protein [Candidatus Parcubacteria bacterium]